MTLLVDLTVVAAVLFTAGWIASGLLSSASAAVRRSVWRATFAGVAAVPLLRMFAPAPSVLRVDAVESAAAAVGSVSVAAVQLPWLWMVWAAGCAAVMLRLATGVVRVIRVSREARRVDGADVSDAVMTPMTWGLLRPQILLPEAFQAWSVEARAMVLRHERAHIASRDWAWQIGARIVTAVLWFLPLAWLADARLRREAERSADDVVITGGVEPAAYAEQLVTIARSVTGVSLSNPGAVGMGGSSLEERVLHVLDRSAKRRTGGWLSPAIVVAFAMILAATMNALPQSVTYRVGDEGVAAPQVLKRVMPRYPEEAKDRRVEGMVVLETIVDGHGVPTNIEVRRSLDPALDRAAIEAASQWLFVPAKKDGKPVSIVVTLEFRFTLR